ncbi:hypothetical protein [Tetragenococcus koreensis]|uniref:hypothetical protein n=1 Tax=Tetragenococcus koreensis TaxID=290335 RepID=UPI001F21250D|nr:hypothetical protein [Tetragenococcus koreensis]MCF1627707.1 hypothetical protein [Tetragenococcus koreensis]MDN6640743.1 hypothetical protein [Tetragenococcus sp.]
MTVKENEKKKGQINIDKELAEQADRRLRGIAKKAPKTILDTQEQVEAWFAEESQDY